MKMDYKWSKKIFIKEEGFSGGCNKTNACPRKDSCVKKDTPFEIENTNQLLTLMSIYQNEWAHYDSIVWRHAFTYFGFIFAIIVFPFVSPWQKATDLTSFFLFPWVFPITGIALAFVLLAVMLRYAARMKCCGKAYRDLIEKLHDDYQGKRLNKKNVDRRITITIGVGIVMCILLIAVAILVMVNIPQYLTLSRYNCSC
jgi:hypothetical protein